MPMATKPRYIPNRGTPDWNTGTEMEKELFLRFCEANPQLICRSLAETTPMNLGGLLVSNPGSRWGYQGSEKWQGVNNRGWTRALDHLEFFYHEGKRRWVVVALPNCVGEPCSCIDELDESIKAVNSAHQESKAQSGSEHLVRHISPANQGWYTPGCGKGIVVVASNIIPVSFAS